MTISIEDKDKDRDRDREKDIINIRWDLRYKITDYVDKCNYENLIKGGRISISSRTTTFYYVEFDENNYVEKINYMGKWLKEIISNCRL